MTEEEIFGKVQEVIAQKLNTDKDKIKPDSKIAEDLGIPINSSDDPLSSVVLGSGLCLERFEDFKSVLNFSPKPS